MNKHVISAGLIALSLSAVSTSILADTPPGPQSVQVTVDSNWSPKSTASNDQGAYSIYSISAFPLDGGAEKVLYQYQPGQTRILTAATPHGTPTYINFPAGGPPTSSTDGSSTIVLPKSNDGSPYAYIQVILSDAITSKQSGKNPTPPPGPHYYTYYSPCLAGNGTVAHAYLGCKKLQCHRQDFLQDTAPDLKLCQLP